uniref:Glycosyltransferase family 25 n=1 Tax=Mimiviridae sp. ChoanoV1 TaxID=2596887 RepID=A0A5B8IH70_9VIRU|nr:glycosyltransferase family 25 [Mimiviridae sp. ChoanoV1]
MLKFLLLPLLLLLILIIFCYKQNFREKYENKIYDSAYYITLPRLKERQKYMINQFKKNNLFVNKYLGQDKLILKENISKLLKEKYIDKDFYFNNKDKVDKNGSIACFISHCSLWKKLKDKPGEVFLIFEDDCKILPNFSNNVNKMIKYVPNDWDMIWLGHGKLKGNFINNNVLVPENNPGLKFNSLHHCYLIKKNSIDKLLKILLPIDSFTPKDCKIRKNFDKFNAYFIKNSFAIQNREKFKKSERKN